MAADGKFGLHVDGFLVKETFGKHKVILINLLSMLVQNINLPIESA